MKTFDPDHKPPGQPACEMDTSRSEMKPAAPQGYTRAEMEAIALPAAWKRTPGNRSDERWFWPVHLLKALARLSAGGAWLAPGRIMDHQKPFASGTWLCAALLAEPGAAPRGAVCPLPGGGELHFYQVLPLYRDELKYSQKHGTAALLEKMAAIGFVARPDRPGAITQGILRRAKDAALAALAHQLQQSTLWSLRWA